MAYCTTETVQVEWPHFTIDATSKPSLLQVDQYCIDVSAEMDARMRAVGVSVSIVDNDVLAVVQPIAINGVKAKALRAAELRDNQDEQAAIFEQLYQDAMTRIEMNPRIVSDISTPGRPAGTTRDDDDIPFTRTTEQW